MTITELSPRIQARNSAAVVVYTQPACQPCKMTKKKLDRSGIDYTEVDVSTDPTALDFVKGLGYSSAPVVYVSTIEGDVHWTGLDVAKIEQYITHADAA